MPALGETSFALIGAVGPQPAVPAVCLRGHAMKRFLVALGLVAVLALPVAGEVGGAVASAGSDGQVTQAHFPYD